MTPSAAATAQPSRPPRSTITSSGSSSWPGGAEPAAAELLELAGLERLLHRAEILPELRAEHRQVRLDAQLRVDRVEHDLLHAHLVGDLVRVRLRARRALDDEPPQRLAQLQPGGRARLVRERDDATDVRDLLQQLAVRRRRLRPRREMHRLRRVRAWPATRFRQRCSVRNGMIGESTRSVWTSAYQSVCSAAASPSQKRDASAGCTSSTDRRGTPRSRGSRRRSATTRSPPSRRRRTRASARRASGRAAAGRRPARATTTTAGTLDVRVRDEERDGVPERQQLALDLLRRRGSRTAGSGPAAARSTASASRRRPCARTRRSASIVLPHEPCISRPRSSSIFS